MIFRLKVFIASAVLLSMLLSLPASASYETGGVSKSILSNGVTLLVKPEPDAHVAAIEIFVGVGAQNEDKSETGIGQLLACSILAGTTTRSTIRLAKLVQEAGGNFHSVWQWNYTEIYAVTLPESCDEGISLLADSIQNAALDPLAVEFSKGTIAKEIRQQDEDTFNSAYTALRKLLHPGSAYGRSYIGDPAKIQSITQQQLNEFYRSNYSPDRIVVSVVGKVDPVEVEHRVSVCFRNMDIRAEHPEQSAAPSRDESKSTVHADSEAAYIMLGYLAPGVDDPDYLPMCVANVLLGGNKSSLLFRKLREDQGLGYQVGSEYPALLGPSHLVAYLGMDASQARQPVIDRVVASIGEQVKFLQAGSFSDDDLERAKRYLIGHHALEHERARDRAFYLGWAEIMGLGYQYDFLYADDIKKVTRADVIRVCNRYLVKPSQVVTTHAAE
jgi:predicted Zn-dependent peptidase